MRTNLHFSYDNSGNPTSYHNGTRWTFSWAKGRQLATASSSGTSASYTYDISGVRNGKTVNGTVYKYNTLSGLVMRQELHLSPVYGSGTVAARYEKVTRYRTDCGKRRNRQRC